MCSNVIQKHINLMNNRIESIFSFTDIYTTLTGEFNLAYVLSISVHAKAQQF